MTQTSNIETNRLVLRPFSKSDAPDVFESCKNPNLGNNAGWKPLETIEETIDVLNTIFIGKEGVWAIVSKETQQVIGSIGIIPDPKRENPHARMLGYWLKEECWGQGFMTEAVQSVLNYGFTQMNLHLITANCYPHNQRSQRVLEKNGFVYEGRLHQAELMHTGQIEDHLCYYLENPSLSSKNNIL